MIPNFDTLPVNCLTNSGIVYIHTTKAVDEDSFETGNGPGRYEPETGKIGSSWLWNCSVGWSDGIIEAINPVETAETARNLAHNPESFG